MRYETVCVPTAGRVTAPRGAAADACTHPAGAATEDRGNESTGASRMLTLGREHGTRVYFMVVYTLDII